MAEGCPIIDNKVIYVGDWPLMFVKATPDKGGSSRLVRGGLTGASKPKSERAELLERILASPAVQAAIAKGELSEANLRKDSTERLKAKWLSRGL